MLKARHVRATWPVALTDMRLEAANSTTRPATCIGPISDSATIACHIGTFNPVSMAAACADITEVTIADSPSETANHMAGVTG